MLEIRKVATNDDIQQVCDIADNIWHECYFDILPKKQIAYMLNLFLSVPAIKKSLLSGTEFYQILSDQKLIGFYSIKDEPDHVFLSKIYFLPEARGLHVFSKIFETLKTNNKNIVLTVNKLNAHAIDVYTHKGFIQTDSVVTDIGNNYYMDDYILTYYRK